jgi:hypothetical protein
VGLKGRNGQGKGECQSGVHLQDKVSDVHGRAWLQSRSHGKEWSECFKTNRALRSVLLYPSTHNLLAPFLEHRGAEI